MPEVSTTVNEEDISFTKSDVREAFDRTEESLDDRKFEMNYSPWHFVEFDGVRKPVKHVYLNIDSVSEVADSRQAFTTLEAEGDLEKLGVDLYNRKENAGEVLRDTFKEILEDYPKRTGGASKDKRLYQLLVNKAPNFVKHIANKNFEDDEFIFRGTAGKGKWPNIPWVSVLHPEETDTTQHGVYVVYLFDPEDQAVYATLNQGVTKLEDEEGKREARKILKKRADKIRESVNLEDFSTDEPEFSDKSNLYGPSTIYQKKYELDNFPESNQLESDLKELIQGYKTFLEQKEEIMGRPGKDITNLAKQHSSEYDYDREGVLNKVEEFKKKFPEDRIEDLNIDEWAPRSNNSDKDDALYYWLQYETEDVLGGFFPGPNGAKAYVVRYDDGELTDHYRDKPEETFNEIKQNVLEALNLVDKEEYSKIDSIEPLPRGSVLLRWFVFYRPQEIIPIYTKNGMKHTLEALDLDVPDGYFAMNKKLLDYKESYEVFSDWSNYKFTRFVWNYQKGEIEEPKTSQKENQDNSEGKLSKYLEEPEFGVEIPDDDLYFEKKEKLEDEIYASLNSGKNIIFTGPPGTGKTKLAKSISKQVSGEAEGFEGEDSVEESIFTTATADWTAFDTIGGYMPSDKKGENLEFEPGQFLKCFREGKDVTNKWLVIDEVNRSDIDKAFGQLFSVLSGDSVELPYSRDENIEIRSVDNPNDKEISKIEENKDIYPVTDSWRLIATMNTLDKTSLYEMSYAFMRRFNFIHVGVPDLVSDEVIDTSFLEPGRKFADVWVDDEIVEDVLTEEIDGEEVYKRLSVLWFQVNKTREIGPSIILDILKYLEARGPSQKALNDAISSLIFPQMEGLTKDDLEEFINNLDEEEVIDEENKISSGIKSDSFRDKAESFFNREIDQ